MVFSNASMKHGATALETAFRKYDRDGGGYLDSFEFEKAATDMFWRRCPRPLQGA